MDIALSMVKRSNTQRQRWQEELFDGRISSKDSFAIGPATSEVLSPEATTTMTPAQRPSDPGSNTQETAGSAPDKGDQPGEVIPVQGKGPSAPAPTYDYIIFLDQAPGKGGIEQRANALLNAEGVQVTPSLVYEHLDGFVVSLTETKAQRLRALSGVKSVEADATIRLEPPTFSTPDLANATKDIVTGLALPPVTDKSFPGGVLPWGVQAVWNGRDISNDGDFGTGKTAIVIDSGISSSTGDLNISTKDGVHKSWIPGELPLTDGSGHGTHVSGTIAARNNGIGVVGVAPGAELISYKVFDSTGGGGTYTRIIDAINSAVGLIKDPTKGLSFTNTVVNMSLGGSFSSSLDNAVRTAAGQGLKFAIAAGNNGRDADGYSPAAAGDHPNVFTVSAVNNLYRMASFSNYDKVSGADPVDDVDVAAPGVGVISYRGSDGAMVAWQGTSMAAPHIAGLLLMGGVIKGDLVTPYFKGTADPFGLATALPPVA